MFGFSKPVIAQVVRDQEISVLRDNGDCTLGQPSYTASQRLPAWGACSNLVAQALFQNTLAGSNSYPPIWLLAGLPSAYMAMATNIHSWRRQYTILWELLDFEA